VEKQNFLSKVLQKYISNKDIRDFKGNFFYYIFYRIVRKFLKGNIKVRICNFFINASTNKNNMSNGLLNKCYFGDETILLVIKKISDQKKIFLLDCGSNYGFYSFYVASLNLNNQSLAFEASPKTFNSFKANLELNNFRNIDYKNLAISEVSGKFISFYESHNDWESSASYNNSKNNKIVRVETTAIDKELLNKNLSNFVVVIKLDVEGNEFNAIQGGLDTILKYQPLITIELSKYNLNKRTYNFDYFRKFLDDTKYKIYDDKLIPFNIETLVDRINHLDNSHQTIGNYFLFKDSSYIYNMLVD
jgi:FkbM family methyltransferase